MKKVKKFEGKPVYCEELLRNPERYQAFLRVALQYADMICMCYHGGYKDFEESEWSFLVSSITDHEYTNETPVTIHAGSPTMLLYLNINRKTTEWLESKKNIFDYHDEEGNPSGLDDLCFIKDGVLVFCSCTHEEFCYMNREFYALIPEVTD